MVRRRRYRSLICEINDTKYLLSLVYFSFEDHKAIFPIIIRRPSVPVLYDPGKGKTTTPKTHTHTHIYIYIYMC